MDWYEIVLLILILGGFAVFAFYTEIKKVREYTRTEKVKREFMVFVASRLQEISTSLQLISNKD